MARILFLGTHGQYNIGDELLLETFLAELGPENEYYINSYDPEFTTAQLSPDYNVHAFSTTGSKFSLIKYIWGADRIIFGGGSILKELYASVGRNRYATLLMILAVVTFGHTVARKRIAMLNIGVGPVATPFGRVLVRMILTQVDLVIVRDPGSKDLALQSGALDEHLTVGTDAVFARSSTQLLGETMERKAFDANHITRIGLNLNFDIENAENWEYFLSTLAQSILEISCENAVQIVGIPMQSQGKVNHDTKVLSEFSHRIPEIVMSIPDISTTNDAAQLISTCDLIIAERFHTIVMSAILGVPVFALAYDVKVRELGTMLALTDEIIDINRPFDSSHISTPIIGLLNDLPKARTNLLAKSDACADIAHATFARTRTWVIQA